MNIFTEMKNLIETSRNIQNFFIKVFKFFFLWCHFVFSTKNFFIRIKWALYTTGTEKRCGISCFLIITFQYESKYYCKFIWLYCSNNPPILALLKSVLMSLEFFLSCVCFASFLAIDLEGNTGSGVYTAQKTVSCGFGHIYWRNP